MGLASVAATALDRARQLGRLRAANRRLQEELVLVHEMVGESPRLKEAQKILARAAPTDATVLIEGESGTGKELAARAIHYNSRRRDRPLVKVDCTGLNENLLASELFGHERGAFTGAIQQKFAIASLLLGLYSLRTKPAQPADRPSPADYLSFFALGATGIFAYHLALNYGEKTVSAGTASLLVNTTPLFTVFLAAAFLGEGGRSRRRRPRPA
jgi:hypothetical protein